jgi:hypothetical protein
LFEFGLHGKPSERIVPHTLEDARDGSKRRAARPIVAAAAGDADVHQTRFRESPEVLRDGAEGDVGHGRVNGSRGLLTAPDDSENLPSPRGGHGGEHGALHAQ